MKKPTDLLVVLAAAVLTALIASPILAPALTHAEGEENLLRLNGTQNGFTAFPTPEFRRGGTLVVDGLELTLKFDRESYKPGEKPTLTLVAVNKQDKKAKTKAKVLMSSTEPTSPVARAMPMPVTRFEKEIEIEVAAGESRKFPFVTEHAVAAANILRLTVSAGENHQFAGAVAVAAPPQTEELVQLDTPQTDTGK